MRSTSKRERWWKRCCGLLFGALRAGRRLRPCHTNYLPGALSGRSQHHRAITRYTIVYSVPRSEGNDERAGAQGVIEVRGYPCSRPRPRTALFGIAWGGPVTAATHTYLAHQRMNFHFTFPAATRSSAAQAFSGACTSDPRGFLLLEKYPGSSRWPRWLWPALRLVTFRRYHALGTVGAVE